MDEWLWVLLNVGDIDLPKQAQQNQRKEHNRNTKQKGGQLLPHGLPRRGIFTMRYQNYNKFSQLLSQTCRSSCSTLVIPKTISSALTQRPSNVRHLFCHLYSNKLVTPTETKTIL